MGRMSDDLLLNSKTNTNCANNLTEWRSFDVTRQFREVESDYFGRYGIDSQYSPCLFWISSKIDYKEVFFKEHPELRGEVWSFV